jgi:tRNA nucleotidyltransferase (CCA-adding enzyme)
MPELVEDIAYPQLEKSVKSMCKALSRAGFQYLRSDIYYSRGLVVLLLEMIVWRLPPLHTHVGPPVEYREHAQKFKNKYLNDPNVFSGPFIKDSRYIVEIPRKYLSAEVFIERELKNLKLSEAVFRSMKTGCEVFCDDDILKIDNREYRVFLTNYFSRAQRRCK